MQELQNDDGSMSIDKFWKMKKKLSPKDRSKSSVIVNGKEIFSGTAIVKEYEKEFSSRLAHDTINKKFKQFEESTRTLLELYLQRSSKDESEPDFTVHEVNQAIESLSKGTAPGPHPVPPDVYKRAAKSFKFLSIGSK